jgi:hypothetical protein
VKVPSPTGRGRLLCRSGLLTLSIESLRQPPSKSCVVEWPSHLVPVCRASSVGGGRAPISTVQLSRPIPGTTPCHSIMTKACLPDHDGVVPHPFARTDWWNSAPYCHSRGTAPPVTGVVGPVRQVDSGVRPYPHHLLPRTVSVQGLADPRPCQSGVVTRVWWSPVGALVQNHDVDPGPGRPSVRDAGGGSYRPVGTMGLGGL